MPKVPKALIIIFVLALLIRVYRLNTFPSGIHVDEAKAAWEAYSILKTGRDDHGNTLPLYYNSFGDFRPTGIFYLTIPSLIVFGKTVFAIRFPAAFLGALTVLPLYFLTFRITKDKRISLLASLFISIIPWDVATARATSEVVISCFLILTSLVLTAKKPIYSFIFLALSFFFYHSARVMGPILMLTWVIYIWKDISKQKKIKKVVALFLITSIISLILLLSPTGLARYNQVRLNTQDLRSIIINYFSYFDPNFLIGNIAKPFRYITYNTGIVLISIFSLFILGLYEIIKTNKNKILILFLALGPIPAALTLEDSPNLHRAFFILPFLVIIAALGFNFLKDKYKLLYKIFGLAIFITFLSFVVNYFKSVDNFAYEYRDPQMMEVLVYLENERKNYDKVYINNDPDSPYPWYAFFNNIDPAQINSQLQKQVDERWIYMNIIWDNSRCPAANAFNEAVKESTKIMVIDNGLCFTQFDRIHSEAKIIKEFSANGKVVYRVWEYKPIKL